MYIKYNGNKKKTIISLLKMKEKYKIDGKEKNQENIKRKAIYML